VAPRFDSAGSVEGSRTGAGPERQSWWPRRRSAARPETSLDAEKPAEWVAMLTPQPLHEAAPSGAGSPLNPSSSFIAMI
jgi:hypothetical protein